MKVANKRVIGWYWRGRADALRGRPFAGAPRGRHRSGRRPDARWALYVRGLEDGVLSKTVWRVRS